MRPRDTAVLGNLPAILIVVDHWASMSDLSTYHLQSMERINAQFFADGDGVAAVRARAQAADEIVTGCFRQAFPDAARSGIAVMAVGGYGRSQLFPFSDIDLLFLFDRAAKAAAQKEQLSRLLTTLWDSQLRISQSVRTPAECLRLAPDNAELHISLLDARFLAGDERLYQELFQGLPRFYLREQKALLRNLVEMSDTRHERYGGTIYHLEPNVKEGPGGLRDLQVACWVSQLANVTADRLPAHEEYLQSEPMAAAFEAKRFLFALRCYLHYFNGRDNNKLTFDLQETIANEGGGKSFRKTDDIAEWMRDYFRNVRVVDRLASRVIDEWATPGRSLFTVLRDRRSRLSNNDFAVTRGRLFFRNSQVLLLQPELAFRLFEFVSRHGIPLAAETEKRIEQALPKIEEYARATAGLWPVVRSILRLPRAYQALTAMRETGVLFALFPEFELIDCLVIRDFYHRYTVDEHTFLTIETLKRLDASSDPLTARFASLLQEIERPECMFFALLFHDVGKGTEALKHSLSSVKLADQAMARLGVEQEDQEVVRFLIRSHLLMSNVISKRDLNDPETIEQFSHSVGTTDRLKALTLVTYADTNSVNPQAMTPWRKELLWQLYVAAHSRLTGDVEDRRIEATSTGPYLAKASDSGERKALGKFLEGFPERYLTTHSPEQVHDHFQLTQQFAQKKAAVSVQRRHALYEVVVMASDRPFLFASLCAALSSFGLNIEKVEAFANQQRLVLDTFIVSDPNRTLDLNPHEITRLAQTVRRVARGETEVADLLRGRRQLVRASRRSRIEPTVAFDNETSARATIWHVIAQDRVGLLFDLASKFSLHECDIEVVLIETQGHKAIDVFYVVGPEGKLDAARCEVVRKELLAACRSAQE